MTDATTAAPQPTSPPSGKTPRKAALSSWVGSALEYYDFAIYSVAAALVFPQLFFPGEDPLTGTLLSFSTYAVGFLARPLGGIVFGRLGDKLGRKSVLVSTLVVISIPIFVIGALAQLVFGVQLGWFPITATQGTIGQLVLPALVLGSTSVAYVARLTRGNVAENLRSDYVRTARAKGLRPSRVVGVHALRNSLIPVVTFIGIDIGVAMGGAIVTEGIFNIPGIGGLTFFSVRAGETPVVIAVASLLTLVFLVTSLLVDLFYAVLDPRIRYD